MGCHDAELSIVIVDDGTIAELNRTYLDREGPTNVIAFAMQEGPFAEINPHLLGDVVISADTCAEESARAGIAMEARFFQLLVHGILHLLGYDHEKSEQQARQMEAKTNQLLAIIDVEPISWPD